MQHLPTDRLAELGEDIPTPDEAAHLAVCAACAHERAAFQSLVAMAHAEREPFGLPLTRWDAIAAELAAQPVAQPAPVAPRRQNAGLLRIAAGFLLVVGGAIAGRVSAGAGPLPGARLAGGSPFATLTASANTNADSVFFATADEARAAQQRSEMIYQQAASFLSKFDSTGSAPQSPVAYRSRLAALDQMLSTTRDAMREAPHDPVINGYYLTTLGQREATLRQINNAVPATLRVNSF
ncbi:MAG: hypothetical protein ABIY52_04405 [Gemmatimonadaceae bacterium]